MTDLYKEICNLTERLHTQARVSEQDSIIKIFGEGSTALSRAKSGLEDVSELATTSAEHHPYWKVLYECTQICHAVLDGWDGEANMEDIGWSAEQLDRAVKKLAAND